MKSYAHVAQKLFNEPLLITPQRHSALCQLLEARLGAEAGAGHYQRKSAPAVMDDYEDREPSGTGDFEESESGLKRSGNLAIIPVHGTLVMHPEDIAMSECGCAMEDLGAMIDEAEQDPRIERVVYDFRTPGGSVTGIPETGRKILASRKTTIAFTGSECCSAGIWLAEQCQHFYGTQSSRIGSVGVYCMMLDMSAALKKDGVKVNAIQAGKFKLLGAYWKPLSEEERGILQAGVDKIYEQFKEAMESHRVVNAEKFGNGLVFDGEDAAEMGFTDGCVDSLEEALEMVEGEEGD